MLLIPVPDPVLRHQQIATFETPTTVWARVMQCVVAGEICQGVSIADCIPVGNKRLWLLNLNWEKGDGKCTVLDSNSPDAPSHQFQLHPVLY